MIKGISYLIWFQTQILNFIFKTILQLLSFEISMGEQAIIRFKEERK